MPEEPNRQMDAMLKAYAQRRREEAGTPPPLHPATRNLLRGEAARTFKAAGPALEPKADFWESMRVRLMVAGSVCATLCIFAFVFVQYRSLRSSPGEQADRASSSPSAEPRRFNVRLEKGGKDYAGETGVQTAPPPETKSADRSALDVAVPPPSAPAEAAASPAPLDGRMELAREREEHARMEVQILEKSQARGGRSLGLEGRETDKGLVAKKAEAPRKGGAVAGGESSSSAAANAPALREAKAAPAVVARKTKVVSQRGQFQRLGAAAPAAAVGYAAPQLQPILNSFEMQQTGDEIRITDADGSIYAGRIDETAVSSVENKAPPSASVSANESRPLTAEPEGAAVADRDALRQAKRLPEPTVLSLSNFTFRVKGQNRSLNQSVELRGHFSGDLGVLQAATNLALRADRAKSASRPVSAPARIQGRILIDGTNAAELNAILVEPK